MHPSRTLLTHELQNASAVINSGRNLAQRSHFMALRLGKELPQKPPQRAPPLYTGTKKLPKVPKSDHLANGLGAPSQIKFSGPRPQAPSRKLQVPGHRPQVPGPKHRIQASCHWPQAPQADRRSQATDGSRSPIADHRWEPIADRRSQGGVGGSGVASKCGRPPAGLGPCEIYLQKEGLYRLMKAY